MVRLKLTKRWKRFGIAARRPEQPSSAMCGQIRLLCQPVLWGINEWCGSASLGGEKRSGCVRRSVERAKQDAERLAVELLRDFRDGVKEMLKQHGIGEDD